MHKLVEDLTSSLKKTSLYVLFLLLVHPAAVFEFKPRNGACPQNRPTHREEFGFALVGHDFRSITADNFARCFIECIMEERCQSVTYFWNSKQCKLNKESKKTKPDDYEENSVASYMDNSSRARKGSKAFPGSSCKDILINGDAQGDGEYWVDPTASGDPLTVFCDMTTNGGGWTLITQYVASDINSSPQNGDRSDSYKTILPKYNSNDQYLLRNGFSLLKQDMGFTQIRFYCFKKLVGRVFHIMTNNDQKGANVIKFFTTSDTMPVACGSFTRLPDDNSSLAVNCDKWGKTTLNRWGHPDFLTNKRLYNRPLTWSKTAIFILDPSRSKRCDDSNGNISTGDKWQIFVR